MKLPNVLFRRGLYELNECQIRLEGCNRRIYRENQVVGMI